MARRRIKSRPGLFGTVYYYDENGNPIGKSRPGLIEGTRVYTDQNGKYAGKSRPGFLSEEVFTDTDGNSITSYDDLCGEVHFKNGTPVGHTKPGFFDSEYTALEAEDEIPDEYDLCVDEIMDSEDSFVEFEDEEVTGPSSQQEMKRNVQIFLLCLVVCAVLIFVFTIVK